MFCRGYENKIIPAVSNNEGKPIGLVGKNASISAVNNQDYFIVKPGRGNSCSLSVVIWREEEPEIIKTVEYRIVNLPAPEIYWGDTENGGNADITVTELTVNYPVGIPLKAEYSVLSWEVSYKDETASGNGASLAAAEDLLKKIPDGALLQFKFKIISPDSIARIKTAQWHVNSWEEETKEN